MLAAVYRGPGSFRVEEIPIPTPGPGEMLVRLEACGVCGTDIKKIQQGLLTGPRVFGHEMAGVVVQDGGRFREGDRVVLHHHIPCRACFYCERGAYAQCDHYKRNGTTAGFEPSGGGFAEYVKALPWIVEHGTILIPDGVSAEEASFVEPVNTCLKAVLRAQVERGQTVLVVGQGPIGLLLMQLCRLEGADVFTSDTLADRLDLSRDLGAATAFSASTDDVAAEAKALTAGRGVDTAFVAAVGPAAFAQALAATRPAGRILVFAATSPGETAVVDLGALSAQEKQILTSYSASVDVQDRAAQLIFGRELRVRELVSHRLPLASAVQAVELAARPALGVRKVVIQMASA